jgi:uncharacterized phage-associated protein
MSVVRYYDSRDAAMFLLGLAQENGLVFNTTKVQKILYIIYSYYVSRKDIRIFDEQPKAWPYGPVFPKTREIDYSVVYKTDDTRFLKIKEDVELVEVFNAVILEYGYLSASQLTEWSHSYDSPWQKATQKKNFKWNDTIEDQYIRDYFANYKII